jgi:hypothetical protein
MARFARFADVLDLADDALRQLVAGDGDEPERVWAAWALGLRRGDGPTTALLRRAATDEPSAGVRAHLAIMLIANGERAAALGLARRDPAPEVRASAWRCLARMAAPEDRELNELLVHTLATEQATEVRLALVDGMRADAPPALESRALALLDDADATLRSVAIDFALRCRRPGEGFPRVLCEHLVRETDRRLFAELADRWVADAGPSPVLSASVAWPAETAALLLARLGATDAALALADLDGLHAREEPAIDAELVGMAARGRVVPPLRWLLLFVARFLRDVKRDGQWTTRTTALSRVADSARALLARGSWSRDQPVTDVERGLARELVSRIAPVALRTSASLSVPVEALVRYWRGESMEDADFERLEQANWDGLQFEGPGWELLPTLERLALFPRSSGPP